MRDAVRTIVIAWAMLFGLCGTAPALAQTSDAGDEPESDRIERIVAEHAGNDRLQTERPQFRPEPEDFDTPRNPFIEAVGDFFAWLFRSFGWVFQAILISAVICAIVYALWYMFGDMVGLQRQRKDKADEADISDIRDQRPDEAQASALLEEADRLAASGRFAEAVHLLLFRSIEDVRQTRTGGLPQSLTAREIQSLSDLTDRTREALAPIIRIVENSFFGGRPVDRDGWQHARRSYESFAFGAGTS
ncbi:hypothetical protein [Henriciella sp.]|uniref:hypothetical protein n=1 Tax=Henriciella sp. TaxID=1968823 RepID=UPI00260ED3B5|nr:hypothetical protein [Henriciella sp.]